MRVCQCKACDNCARDNCEQQEKQSQVHRCATTARDSVLQQARQHGISVGMVCGWIHHKLMPGTL